MTPHASRAFSRTFARKTLNRRSRRTRLCVENLEDRTTPTTFTVSNTNDSGTGSFRQAISDAVAAPTADDIVFDTAGVFATPQTISLLTALPQITNAGGALTITGPGASNLTIRRDPAVATNFRVFDSLAPTLNMSGITVRGGRASSGTGAGGGLQASGTVTLNGMVFSGNTASINGGAIQMAAGSFLSLTNSTISGNAAGADGGGLQASGTVTLNEMVFSGNTASINGGAIRMAAGGFLSLANSTISGNAASGDGGGIYFLNGGSFVIENTTISGNTAGGPSAGGGGLYFWGTASATPPAGFIPSTLVIRNSTINSNTATVSNGGGIILPDLTGTLLVQNSTITGNKAAMSGGGIVQAAGSGSIQLENSTITGNTANGTAANTGGGGVARLSPAGGSVIIANSVVSGNTNGNGPDLLSSAATTTDVNFSAVGSATGFTLSGTSGDNLAFNTNLQLGPFALWGGTTRAFAPTVGSPLIGAGSNALISAGVTTDQRGGSFARTSGGTVDIGSVEIQPPYIPVAVANAPGVTAAGDTAYTFTVTYSDPTGTNGSISAASLIGNNNAMRVTGPLGFSAAATYVSIDNAADGTPRTVTYSITPPGGSWDPADNGQYVINVQANQVVDVDGNHMAADAVGTFRVLAPYVVTTDADTGPGSLRNAVVGANTTPAADLILFSTAFFNSPRTITLSTALPQFAAAGGPLMITGPDAGLTVQRDAAAIANFRIFDSAAQILNLTGFTVSDGKLNGINTDGAGLQASGNVTLDRMTFTNNQATGANDGGAIRMNGTSFLTLRNCTISGNTAGQNGGGIYFSSGGSFVIENSTITGNTTGGIAASQGGGGIYFFGTATAAPPAGFTPSSLVIRNSTIANNTSSSSGGGVQLTTFTGTLLVQNSTISGNTATNTAAGQGGGGIARTSGTGTITIQNSVISGNTNANGPDIMSPGTVNVNFSAPGSNTGFALSGTSGNNLAFGTVLQLGTLGNNGGPTQTMAPASTSPLVDAGSNALVPAGLTTDQRGGTFDRQFGTVDIGSFEFQPPKVTINQSPTQVDPTNVAPIIYNVVFNLPVTGFDGTDVSFAGSTVGGTLVANVSGSGANYTVSVTGMDGDGLIVASIPVGSATDAFGSGNLASTSTDNSVRFDNVKPTVTINQSASQADPVNVGPIAFAVVFAEPVIGFTAADVSFTGSTIGGTLLANVSGTGPTYTVTVAGMTGDGDLVVSIPANAAVDLAGNTSVASTSTDNRVHFDDVRPHVTINQSASQAEPTNAEPIAFDVIFSEPVTGFDGSDIAFTGSTVGGTLVANVSGSGTTYSVTVTGMGGDGNVVVNIPAGAAADALDNPSFASTSTDNSVRFDNVVPTVTINQAAGQNDPTNGASIAFDVVFSEPVTGFNASDVDLSASTAAGTLQANVTGSGMIYTVIVTGMTGSGTTVASVNAAAATDEAGNASDGSTSTDNTILFDNDIPTATINQAAGQNDPTNGEPIAFDVVFSEPVSGFNAFDIDLSASTLGGTLLANVSGSGTNYIVTVTGMNGDGTVVASIPAAAAFDAAGNASAASTSTDNTVLFDNVGPTVTINQSAGQADPTSSAIVFDVHFNESVTGFDGSDVSFAGSTVGGTLQANVTGSGTDYTVTVTGMFGIGSVVASIPGGVALDAAGNGNQASTSFDNTVTYDNVGTIQFDAPVFTVKEENGFVIISVSRVNGTDGAVTIDYATSDFSAHSGSDYAATTGTLNWASGEGGSKSFTVAIVDDTANEGRENFNLTLSNPTGSAHLGASTAQASIDPSDPKGPGTLFDQDGDKVTLKVLYGGTLGYYLTDWDGDGKGPIELIELSDTNPLKSVVTLNVLKATTSTDNGRIGLGAITGTGIKTMSAGRANLNMEGINLNGYLGALTIGDVQNGADIIALGTPTQKTRITAGVIGNDTTIKLGSGISVLTAKRYGSGLVNVPSIGTMSITGNLPQHVTGDMGADVTVNGNGVLAGVPAIKVLKVTGSIPAGADITAPSIGAMTVLGSLASEVKVSGAGVLTGKPAFGALKVVGPVTGSDIQVGGLMTSVVTGAFNGTINASALGAMTVKGNLNGNVTLTGTGLAAGKVALPVFTITGSVVDGSKIVAPSIGTMAVKGDLAGDLTVTGPSPAVLKPALAALKVTGAVTGSNISVGGDIATVLAGAFRDSNLFVGYDDVAGTFNPVPANVGLFKVTGFIDAFANSHVFASTFKNVVLQSVKSANLTGKFGFIAHQSVLALTVAGPTPFVYNVHDPGPQGFGDFEVKIA